MTAAPHPGATPAQRRALDALGAGNASPPMSPKVRDALLAAGLIVELPPLQVPFAGRLVMQVRQFDMPAHVHMAWCAHCSAAAAVKIRQNPSKSDSHPTAGDTRQMPLFGPAEGSAP